jgi:hypothetical protein
MRKCVVRRAVNGVPRVEAVQRAEAWRWRRFAGGAVATTALLFCGQARASFAVNYDIPNRTGQTADALSVIMNANASGTVPLAQNSYNGGLYWPFGETGTSVTGATFSLFSSLDTTAGAVFGTGSTTRVAEFRWDFAVPGVATAPDGSKGVHIGATVTNSSDCTQFAQRIFFRDTSGNIITPHVSPVDPALCFVTGPHSGLNNAALLPSTLAPGQTATATLPLTVSPGMQVISRTISIDPTGKFELSVFRETDPAPAGTTGVTITITNPIPPDGSQGVTMNVTTLSAGVFSSPVALTDLNPTNQTVLQKLVPILTPQEVPALGGGHLGTAALGIGLFGLGATLVRRRLRRS